MFSYQFEKLNQFGCVRHVIVGEEDVDAQGFEQIVWANQVHSSRVALVDNFFSKVDSVDGLITVHKGVTLAIRHADCQAALFVDPVTQVIANVHAGWRGMVKNIYQECVGKMCKEKGCQPKNLHVFIGPSLGPKWAQFIHYQQEFPQEWWRFRETGDLFNLWEIARWQLKQCGLLDEHIEVAGICTYDEGWYSYRRDKTAKRHVTLIELRV